MREALGYNGYPDWMLATIREEIKEKKSEEEEATTVTTGVKREDEKRPVIIPYIRGFSEELKRTFGGYGIPTYFKPTNTLRQLLVHPKDPVGKDKVVGPVYKISCEVCEATYVGETERSLKAIFGEHRRSSSTTSEVSKHIHTDSPDHTITFRIQRYWRWSTYGLKEEWRRQYTSRPYNLHSTEDDTTYPRSGKPS